jgi:hypothetical protein
MVSRKSYRSRRLAVWLSSDISEQLIKTLESPRFDSYSMRLSRLFENQELGQLAYTQIGFSQDS